MELLGRVYIEVNYTHTHTYAHVHTYTHMHTHSLSLLHLHSPFAHTHPLSACTHQTKSRILFLYSCNTDQNYALAAAKSCVPCGSECVTTTGSGGCPNGTLACAVCVHTRQDGVCVANCAVNRFADLTQTSTALGGVCVPCNALCAPGAGCTGPAATQCNACATFRDTQTSACVSACSSLQYLNSVAATCNPCNAECLYGCYASSNNTSCKPSSSNSTSLTAAHYGCVHVVSLTPTPTCLPECPTSMYADTTSVCRSCSPLCPASRGCTGPTSLQCNACPTGSYVDPTTQVISNLNMLKILCHVFYVLGLSQHEFMLYHQNNSFQMLFL